MVLFPLCTICALKLSKLLKFFIYKSNNEIKLLSIVLYYKFVGTIFEIRIIS